MCVNRKITSNHSTNSNEITNYNRKFCQITCSYEKRVWIHFLLFHKFSVKLNSCTYLLFMIFSCHCITAPLSLRRNGQFITFQMHEMTQNCNSTLINWSKIGFWTTLAGQNGQNWLFWPHSGQKLAKFLASTYVDLVIFSLKKCAKMT